MRRKNRHANRHANATSESRSQPITDQRRRVQHVGHAQHAQTAHAGPELRPVPQLLRRKSSTLRQVELEVALSQRLQGRTGERTCAGEHTSTAGRALTWFSDRPLLSGTKRVDCTFRSLRRLTKLRPSSDT